MANSSTKKDNMNNRSKIQDPADVELICKLHAERVKPAKIIKIMEEELPGKYVTLTYKNIKHVTDSPENKHKIDKFRAVYLANPMDVDIANKRIRLEDLDRERVRIVATIEKRCGKDGLIPKKGWSMYTTLIRRLIDLEVAGRDEVERKPDLLEAFSRFGPLADLTDEELRAYEREVTIKLTAYKSGTQVQRTAEAKITDRTRD